MGLQARIRRLPEEAADGGPAAVTVGDRFFRDMVASMRNGVLLMGALVGKHTV